MGLTGAKSIGIVPQMTADKRPLTATDLENPGEPAKDIHELAGRVSSAIDRSKAALLDDERFMGEMLLQALNHPMDSRESGCSHASPNTGATGRLKRHAIKGRTEKRKMLLLLSETEASQLEAYRAERGERTCQDLVNEMVVRALAALRAI